MSLSIVLTDLPVPEDCRRSGYEQIRAELCINDFSEHIDIPIGYWTIKDYLQQWMAASDELLTEDNSARSALITQIFDLEKKEFGYALECWSLYKVGEGIFIRNAYLPYDELSLPFDSKLVYELIGARDFNEDGTPAASEWKISRDDLQNFRTEIQTELSKLHS